MKKGYEGKEKGKEGKYFSENGVLRIAFYTIN